MESGVSQSITLRVYEQEARKRNKWKRNKQNVETVELWFG